MKSRGEFIFKGVTSREGGEFTNEKGDNIKFDSSYIINLDEIIEGKAINRNFKFSKQNTELYEKLKNFELYDNLFVTFDINIYKTNIKLIPIDVEPA